MARVSGGAYLLRPDEKLCRRRAAVGGGSVEVALDLALELRREIDLIGGTFTHVLLEDVLGDKPAEFT